MRREAADIGVGGPPAPDRELSVERAHVAQLYSRLDTLRARAAEALRSTRRGRAGGSAQAQSERDAFDALWSGRVAQLSAVDDGLCFGRLDLADGGRLHLGRLGLSAEDQTTLLVDWRAPVAEPFYRATALAPMGAVMRRNLRTRGREVTGYDDEWLSLDAVPADGAGLTGESALLAALSSARTGRMRDVVATLQAEQDRIVRADRGGVLVVQGGPGTGKTAVALHRAAYLLYTYRERLAATGVLVIGPNPVFLRYVEQVLPSLGETAVVLSTVAQLVPGLAVTGTESDQAAGLKGDRRMVELVANALRGRQQVPRQAVALRHDGVNLRLEPRSVEEGRRRGRESRRPYNQARSVFVRHVLTDLGRQLLGRSDWSDLDRSEQDDVLRDLIRDRAVRAAVNDCWPYLTPAGFVRDLWSDRGALAAAGPWLRPAQVDALARPSAAPLTEADVPIADEVAELLGDTDAQAARVAPDTKAARSRAVSYAQDVLASSEAAGFVSAEALAQRFETGTARLTLGERAAGERAWGFGHVVVDEAQELSWMAWRAVLRRCPSRSMTVVGDVAQASSSWATTDWAATLEAHAPGQWRIEELTVGYRTPAEVMTLAGDVLGTIDPALTVPRAVRSTGHDVGLLRCAPDDVAPRSVAAVVALLAEIGEGRIGVLVAAAGLRDLRAALAESPVLRAELGADLGEQTSDRVAVLTVSAAKGLEFDAVLLVDPAAVLAAHPRGASDLYVALTRTTDRLVVISPGPLPAVLAGLG